MSVEVLEKLGPELFKELFRIYPVAAPEDYYKNGIWKDDVMRVDIRLIEAHRNESGAPDAPELADVEVPELPSAAPKAVPGIGGISKLVGAVKAVVPGTAPAAAGAGGQQTAAAASIAELRLIALFVAKWKIDPTKAKGLLARLTPTRRRYVIQNFKTTVAGPTALVALETYISQCEKSGAWDKGAPVVASAPTAVTPRGPGPLTVPARATSPTVAAGVKRPILSVNPALDPAKRPRIGGPVTVAGRPGASAATAALAARIAAGRGPAAQPGARIVPVRPQIPKAGPMRPVAQPNGALIRNLLQRF